MPREVRTQIYFLPLIVFALLASQLVRAEEPAPSPQGNVYKDVAPDGSITYTDRPTPDAEKIKIPKGTEYTPPPIPVFTPTPKPKAPSKFEYDSFALVAPKNEESIWDNTGNITATVAFEPFLQSGHSIEFLLDGTSVTKGTDSSYQFMNLPRGAHQITAQIVDSADEVLATSSVTVFLRKHSIK